MAPSSPSSAVHQPETHRRHIRALPGGDGSRNTDNSRQNSNDRGMDLANRTAYQPGEQRIFQLAQRFVDHDGIQGDGTLPIIC